MSSGQSVGVSGGGAGTAGVDAASVPRCEAGADRPLMDAYLRTVYRVEHGGRSVEFAFGRFTSPGVAEATGGGDEAALSLPAGWAIVSAYNPMSCPLPDADNRARDEELGRVIRGRGLDHGRTEGRAPEGDWREPGWVVVGVGRDVALGLGRAFGQRAVVWGVGGRVGVLDCRTEHWAVRPVRVLGAGRR